jgi:hypothetical protein
MKVLGAFAVVAGLLLSCTEGLALQKRSDGPLRVVGLPIQRREVLDPVARDRLRRRGTVNEPLDNEVNDDCMNFTIIVLITP